MGEPNDNHTSIGVHQEILTKFKRSKPFDQMTADEFLQRLLEEWEANR